MTACPGCGAVLPGADGPAHPYMVSSVACWAAFGRLQADETARFGYPPVHGLVVDAFAAGHPGDGSERRDRQSVSIHLMALCARLERGTSSEARIALLRRLTERKRDWPVLSRPPGFPALTHLSVAGATDAEDYEVRARAWATAVWVHWSPVHGEIAATLDQAW